MTCCHGCENCPSFNILAIDLVYVHILKTELFQKDPVNKEKWILMHYLLDFGKKNKKTITTTTTTIPKLKVECIKGPFRDPQPHPPIFHQKS